MRLFSALTLFVSLIFIFSCSNEKEEPEVDCSTTDLELSLGSSVEPDCSSLGSITVMANGGNGSYAYKINGTSEQSSETFEGLGAGLYIIEVTDKNDCSAELNVNLNAAEGSVSATFQQTSVAGCEGSNGEITASATGGGGDYVFSLDGGASSANNTFSNLSAGSHSLEVTDSEGCSTTLEVLVSSGTSLSQEVMPIINNNCATSNGCHGNGASGRPVFEGSPSKVIEYSDKVKEYTQSGYMPKDGSLTQEQKDLIACWVDDGALNN